MAPRAKQTHINSLPENVKAPKNSRSAPSRNSTNLPTVIPLDQMAENTPCTILPPGSKSQYFGE
jgi:hypothetical protein